MKRIAVAGSTNLDTIYTVEAHLNHHSKVRASARAECVGGSAANTARWLSREGFWVSLFSRVGLDPAGELCLQSLRSCGNLDLANVRQTKQPTSTAVCISGPESKVIVTFGGAEECVAEPPRAEGGQFDHIHVAAPDTDPVAGELLRNKRPEATVSLELNGRPFSRFARDADIVFSNADEIGVDERVTTEQASMLLERIGGHQAALFVITLGARGSLCRLPSGDLIRRPALRADVVDRTGAGDAFDAGFLTAYLTQNPVDRCLESGQELAARCLQIVGGAI